ncbi:hypothetical protein [Pseudolysinimonas sp.]|uniref:hypothetical protein n=1 Tax=Pseudolysinimonas sp. TaxID=2680009 RepID=UPI003F81FBC8
MRGRRTAAAILALGVALALTACFPPAPSETGKAIPGALTVLPELSDPQILQYCPGTVPQHFDGVAAPLDRVYACRADVRIASDGATTHGPWQVVYLLPTPQKLLAAYAQPDAAARPPSACGAQIADPLLVWVDRGGSTTSYHAPVDGCGAPTAAAARAYRTATRIPVIGVDTGSPDYRPTRPSSPYTVDFRRGTSAATPKER